jgi:indolepyruvate ferredoxin oxidoreductase
MSGHALRTDYRLQSRYDDDEGRVFLTGIQALVRLPLMQARLDRARGLNTGGFISGYRGSPLGGYDLELQHQSKILNAHDIHFEPGLNEDLAATALWGTQQLPLFNDAKKDGVFGIWYGKGPGVDRCGDIFRTANTNGTSRLGGVLAISGDDHAAHSSMFPHQTEQIFQAVSMPVLHPATVAEFLELGLAGIELSRYSGLWVGFKTISETVESGVSLDLPSSLPRFATPEGVVIPPWGLNFDPNLRWPAERAELERRVVEYRLPAALAFARANGFDKVIIRPKTPRFGLITVGKAHLDMLQALSDLGLTRRMLEAAGIGLYKVAMTWPLEPQGLREFASGMDELLVVEEKRPLVEGQIKEHLYNRAAGSRPRITGKTDETGAALLPAYGELSPLMLARILVRRLAVYLPDYPLAAKLAELEARSNYTAREKMLVRKPFFCAGCPHNRSTKVPDGSIAGGGIGCHVMAVDQDRDTAMVTQMGGEGVPWVGLSRFVETPHMFQNLGDGTYQHSGVLAIRQAVAAGVNMTYKILYNDAVAMTGGQMPEGHMTPLHVAQQVRAEGVNYIALVSAAPEKYDLQSPELNGIHVYPREQLEGVQKDFRERAGVSAIIYEQTCAAELRRRRKRGTSPKAVKRVFINHRVCEGCGDCSVKSNCIAVEPLETAYGRKRKINQSVCNQDLSCLEGFCPSFVSLGNVSLRKPDLAMIQKIESDLFAALPVPLLPTPDAPYNILIVGIGGTGVITVGALVSMAAHLSGMGASVLDFTGLSQKNGAVVSHVRIAPKPADISVARIPHGAADVLIGCDSVASASDAVMERLSATRTQAVINTEQTPTADFVMHPDVEFPATLIEARLKRSVKPGALRLIEATVIATRLMGDAISANLFQLGYAWQLGLIPVSAEAIEQAITLNGAKIADNHRAFRWGRLYAHNPAIMDDRRLGLTQTSEPLDDALEAVIERHSDELKAYQNAAYAARYLRLIEVTRPHGEALTRVVAETFFRLMAYKDEYEVARLYSDPMFKRDLEAQFEGKPALDFHMAPPLLSPTDPATGERRKVRIPGWLVMPVFGVLRRGKVLRGTVFDLFGRQADRKLERQLIGEYEALVHAILAAVTPDNRHQAVKLAGLHAGVRGFGHVKQRNYQNIKANASEALRALQMPHETVAPKPVTAKVLSRLAS